MQPARIASVDKSDQARVVATLVSAFIGDPVERWLFAEPVEYLTHFAGFVAAFGAAGFATETVFRLGDFAAVAIWVPPGVEVNGDAVAAALSDTVRGEKQAATFSVLEQMDAAHPKEPHWYLPWLGFDIALQGLGLGAALLRHGLARVDADHLPAFLETPNPRTIPRAPRICRDERLAGWSLSAGNKHVAPGRLTGLAPALRGKYSPVTTAFADEPARSAPSQRL